MARKNLPQGGRVEQVTFNNDPKFAFGSTNFPLVVQDQVLWKQGRGDFLKIYADLFRDTRVQTTFEKRVTNVTRAEWIVEPGVRRGQSVTREDERIAEMVKEQLNAMGTQTEQDSKATNAFTAYRTGFDAVTAGLLRAIVIGFSVGEMIWQRDGATVYVDRIRMRDERRFRFDHQQRLRLITKGNMWTGELLPAKKYLVYTWGSQFDPYGLGLGNQLYWPVFFKRQGMSFWLRYLDKFGMPTVLATGDPKNKESLLDAGEKAQSESVVYLNDGEALSYLEAARTAIGSGGYSDFTDYHDKEITTLMLGSTLSTDIGDKGSFAAADVHKDETRLRGMTDAQAVNEYLTRSLSTWITFFNSDTAVPPIIKRLFPEEEDLSAVAERWQKLFQMGYKPIPDFVNEKFGKGAEEPVFELKAEDTPPALEAANGQNNADEGAEGDEDERPQEGDSLQDEE